LESFELKKREWNRAKIRAHHRWRRQQGRRRAHLHILGGGCIEAGGEHISGGGGIAIGSCSTHAASGIE
jgi:hypothetical protein